MKKLSFEFNDFAQWKRYLVNAIKHLAKGVVRIIIAIVVGLWSLLVHLWRATVKLVSRYPAFALGAFIVIVCFVWLLTFINMRHRAVKAEDQRDAISWKYQNLMNIYGHE